MANNYSLYLLLCTKNQKLTKDLRDNLYKLFRILEIMKEPVEQQDLLAVQMTFANGDSITQKW